MSSTKQLMQGRSNTGWSIRDSSCRNCHHYDRVGTYLCPHHRIGHNLECGSCNIRLGTQHLPAIHVRVLRDKWLYRASFTRPNHPAIPPPEILHDHRRQRPDRSSPARRSAGPARRRPGRGRRAGGRPLRQHPPGLRDPVAHLRRLVRRGRARIPAGAAAHRGPLPGRPRQFRRQYCHTLRLATSAIAKAHEWAKLESPCRDPGVRASSKGWGRRLSKPQRQAGSLTADVLAVIRLTAVQPRRRGRGIETPEQAAERGTFDVALVAVLSDGGLRRSEASSLTWGDVQRWDDGSGRITVIRSKTDVEATGAVVAITPTAMRALDAIRPAGVGGEAKVFGLSESQIARRVKAIAKAAGLADWELFSGHSGRVGMARRMAQNGAPTHEIERQGRWKQGGGMVGRYTRGETAGSALRYL